MLPRRVSRGHAVRAVLGVLVISHLAQRTVVAQAVSTDATQIVIPEENYFSLKWWHPLVASAGVALLFAVDKPIHSFWQDHQSETLDDLANFAKKFKEPEVFAVSSVGAMSLGLVIGDPKLAQTGLQILGAYGLSSGMMIATKWAFGRSRPSQTPDDHLNFDWFKGDENSSFPSGSSAVVFSLAATVSDAVGNTWVTVGLYSGAVLNSWSRVYTERHWFTDVALGALYGITAAKIVNGRWRIFGWRPPTVIVGAGGRASLMYSLDF